jgi:hypothetical protein
VDPQSGPITGKEGGPMSLAKPAINWSHVTGKRHSSDSDKAAAGPEAFSRPERVEKLPASTAQPRR